MAAIQAIFEGLAILLVGLAVRLLLFVALLAVFTAPILLVIAGAMLVRKARARSFGELEEGGFRFRAGAMYAPGHVWLRREVSGPLRLGLDDLAQRLFTDVKRVSFVPAGTFVREGDALMEIRTDGKTTVIPSPVEGVVVAGNDEVSEDPSLIHSEPYRRGWLLRIRPSDARYRWALRGSAARSWMRDENTRLGRLLEQELGMAAADGGELVVPPAAWLSDAQWQVLTRAFLRTR